MKQLQHVVFEEIGEMAPQLMYVHVLLPLNITSLYQQAEVYKAYLTKLSSTKTSDYKRIPFTKAARDTGLYGIRKINRIMQKLKNLDLNLPHLEAKQKREAYRAQPEWDPKEKWLYIAKSDIKLYNHRIQQILYPPKPDFPESFWEAYEAPQQTSTFRPFNSKLDKSEEDYLQKHYNRITTIYENLIKEQKLANATLPDFYIHNRDKRFIQTLTLFNDIVGTFMGAFNAYEIRQLKLKFQELESGHNMLVRVTETHAGQINDIHSTMKRIIEIVHYMAEYNPGILMMQIDEQLEKFEDRVTLITNAIQQLHHRRLAVDVLSPEQMEIMHNSVETIALQEGFHNQVEHISDYFQIEVTYLRTGEDIVIIVHVPCIKSKALLKIYRYLPFPITLPFTPRSHDMTIRQSLDIQSFNLPQQSMDAIFDQNNLDHQQYPEALFITDKSDLIAIGADKTFQILTQMDLTNCVQRNHVYLCDKNNVVKTDLTESCLGSLYLRQENGVRKHCKFERRPVQEIVYQLTDTEHLVYSPMLQTSSIVCRNNTQETVYLDQSTRITVPQGCSLALNKHTIHSERQTNINPHPLHGAWTWDPLSLPSTLLSDPEHLDHLLYQLRTDFNKIDEKFIAYKNQTSSPTFFEDMLVHSTFSTNPTSIIIWSALCLSSIANFSVFLAAVYYFYFCRQYRNYDQQPAHNNNFGPQPANNQGLQMNLLRAIDF